MLVATPAVVVVMAAAGAVAAAAAVLVSTARLAVVGCVLATATAGVTEVLAVGAEDAALCPVPWKNVSSSSS
jgi:hypothetical protein